MRFSTVCGSRTYIIVTEATSAVDAHWRVDAIILASGTLRASVAGVTNAGAVGRNEVSTTIHGAAADEGFVLVDLLRYRIVQVLLFGQR